MSRAHIGIGSNIDPAQHVPWAIQHLREEFNLLAVAPTYVTEPLGRPEQPMFWNTMVVIETEGAPEALHTTLRAMEANAGRVRTEDKFAARPLDLDILLWDGTAPDADAQAELKERPWNQWCLHRLGDAPAPSVAEPALA